MAAAKKHPKDSGKKPFGKAAPKVVDKKQAVAIGHALAGKGGKAMPFGKKAGPKKKAAK